MFTIVSLKTALPKLHNEQNVPFKALKELVNITLDKHAPLKTIYIRVNQSPFMNKKLRKEIMKKSRLRNKFLKTSTTDKNRAYDKQCNNVVSLLRNEKKIIVILIPRLWIIEYFGKLSSHFSLKRLLNILKLTWLRARILFLAMKKLLKRLLNTL